MSNNECALCGKVFPILKLLYWPFEGPYCCPKCIQRDIKNRSEEKQKWYEDKLDEFRNIMWGSREDLKK